MSDPIRRSLCDAVDGSVLMGHMGEFARWVKLSGTPDELTSLQYVKGRLDEFGYRTELLRHDAYISLPGRARVTVGNQALTSITHSFSRSSPAEGAVGRLVYVGDGAAADFAGRDVRGAIVLTEGIASPAQAANASHAGAAGQIQISPHEHLHEMCVSPVWGSPSAETVAQLPSTVVCTVSNADGGALRERLERGEQPRATLHAEVDSGWRQTPILVAELDGPEPDGPFVLYSGHHDTWYYGVMDNGAANATMLEVARLLAPQRAQWRRGLRLCFWSGHSHGRYSGSTWYADQHWDELERRCAVHVNVDSTGGVGAVVLTNAAAAPELLALAGEAIGEQTGESYAGKRMGRSGDQSFWGIGIPAMFGTLSEQPPAPVKMRNALGWWWHTPHDTLDKIDRANLVRDTKVYVHALWRLLSDPVLPLDFAAHARTLLEELGRIRASLDGRFPVDGLVAAAEALHDAAAAGGHDDAALMRASRALAPVYYTTGDRFVHDAALPLPAWPALQPLRDLARSAPGSDAAHVLTVSATRGRNRMLHALREATAALGL
ncbi:MAG TPA: M28 family peptidase [Acetobacteraceae bacterium]|nr:M28 family peptidase [Acetobacteraceae bacterium]